MKNKTRSNVQLVRPTITDVVPTYLVSVLYSMCIVLAVITVLVLLGMAGHAEQEACIVAAQC